MDKMELLYHRKNRKDVQHQLIIKKLCLLTALEVVLLQFMEVIFHMLYIFLFEKIVLPKSSETINLTSSYENYTHNI